MNRLITKSPAKKHSIQAWPSETRTPADKKSLFLQIIDENKKMRENIEKKMSDAQSTEELAKL